MYSGNSCIFLVRVNIWTLRQDFLRWLINSPVVSPAVWLPGDFFWPVPLSWPLAGSFGWPLAGSLFRPFDLRSGILTSNKPRFCQSGWNKTRTNAERAEALSALARRMRLYLRRKCTLDAEPAPVQPSDQPQPHRAHHRSPAS